MIVVRDVARAAQVWKKPPVGLVFVDDFSKPASGAMWSKFFSESMARVMRWFRTFRPDIALRSLVLLFTLLVGGVALHLFASLNVIEDVHSADRESWFRSARQARSEEMGAETRSAFGVVPDRPRGSPMIGVLLDLAETHRVGVQLDVLPRPSSGDARIRFDAKLTGAYKGIRAWLVDACKSSPELLVATVRFRRGTTDGDARAEIIFEHARQ